MQHLALRIYKGTHGASPDEHPLVSVGAVPATFCPIVPSLVDEPETWILVHRFDYTLYVYQVILEKDSTYRQICLLVPADMRLSADDNPYGLLLELWGILESQGNQNVLFEERLARCVSEERMPEMCLPVMDGKSPASFCADSRIQVKALLMFSLYPQLANVNRLEIGLHCVTTVALPIKAKTQISQSESASPKESIKLKVASPVSEKMKDKQTGKTRNKRKKIVYAFLLIAIAVGLGGVYKLCNKKSVDSEIAYVTDSVASVPLKQKEENLLPIDINSRINSMMKEEAKKRKEEAEKRVGQQEKMKARNEILELVNRKDLMMCRQHPGWNKYLTTEERWAIEMILTDDKKLSSKGLSPIGRKKLQRFMDDKWPFSSFEEVIQVRKEIIKIINVDDRIMKEKNY